MQNIGAFIAQWREALFEFGLPGRRDAGRRMLLTIIVAIVAAAMLRIGLADYSPWFDEFASLYFAGLPMSRLWGTQAVLETNPPLFYSLLAFWKELGAQSVVEFRTLPILAGTISLALAGYIASRWLNARAGVIAVILMGLSAQHIFYSHLLRGIILTVDGVLLSMVGLLMIVHQRQRGEAIAGWGFHVAGSSLAIYCHTTMLLWPVVAAAALVVFFGKQLAADRARLLIGLIAANLVILAIASWWLWITFLQLRGGAEPIAWLKPIGLREYVFQILATCMLTFDHFIRDKFATNLIAILTIASAITLWRDRTGRFIIILALAAIAVFGIAGALKPILMPRTIFWMSIFPVLLISGSLGALRSAAARWGLVAACVGLLVVNLARQAPRFELQDWQAAVSTVARDRQALLLVQGREMAVTVRAACLLHLHRPCPFPVVVVPQYLDPRAGNHPSWAAGSAKETPLRELRQHIPADVKVFGLRRSSYDPFMALGIAPANRWSDHGGLLLEGPFATSVVLAGQP